MRIRLRVKPGGRRDRLLGAYGGALKLEVAAAPERGRANAAVAKLLAETFGLAASDVSVVTGASSQDKVVELAGCPPETVVARLHSAGIDATFE